ncbi:plasma-membrane proton-efflux P-type ATPase [Desulforhabdus amnigena]|jgi:H+-transporting ATPase|uniref:Plasma-membrane proton-efflux P-type ATPase n=1 Tax=Desulforhabdus amnigena TaxID=40218 RepID=A0A9W6CXX2_9BACT|nr:plasma-membrane proton-efflux P-type ATPase [Desulforhabdus amnigena]NLJ27324.1 plasma-membrane proton-efflux P-type ATPase [Deltaproteobacteria bacterium]GLI34679.1 plasma-membrane proton-efflux P-type ATPase [Desulforhabdus amnigena]
MGGQENPESEINPADEHRLEGISLEQARKMPLPELLARFDSTEAGLSAGEAKTRLDEYGFNEISEKKIHPILEFLGFFWGPIPWMIEAAALLAGFIHHWEDFYIILTMLLLNAGVGFWQRQKAENAIALLKDKLALNARVQRDRRWMEVPARELVPGDVVRIRLGDIIPADIKLMDGDYLMIDESALTGESLPVERPVGDTAYAGSIIRQGEMNALVVATGMETFLGKTARLVTEARTQSHFQKALVKIGDYLIAIGLGLVAIVFLVALFRHESLMETLQYALVLTVAAVPATLPAVLSVTLAVGAAVLADRGAIASKMAAIDELAGMDILCSDKTGTITQNALTVGDIAPLGRFLPEEVLVHAALASREEDRDAIDDAVLARVKELPDGTATSSGYKILEFKPFDPISKRTEAFIEAPDGNRFRVAKGAPQVIASLSREPEATDALVEEQVNAFAAQGYRALAVARTDQAGNWNLMGLISLYDPPRPESAQTIQLAQSLGIQVKMVTGDHKAIAQNIARQVNLGTHFQLASDLLDLPDRKARHLVKTADGFAQVFPEHKYHIIELLQEGGHIVGMTGDGVNDAPALRKADVGIAVAGATDAAKSAAHIVLTHPGLGVIVDAIQESRKIFQRMKSYAIYRIGGIIRVLLFVTLSILIFNFYPVTAVMIVLMTLLNDLPILSIAYDNVSYSRQPEKWNMREILSIATYLGLMGVFFSFSIFLVALKMLHLNHQQIQTLIFLKLSIAGYLDIFMGRTRSFFWSSRPGAMLLWSGIATRILATAIALFGWYMTSISWQLVLIVWGWAAVELLVTDPIKVWVYRVLDHNGIIFRR